MVRGISNGTFEIPLKKSHTLKNAFLYTVERTLRFTYIQAFFKRPLELNLSDKMR